MSSSAAARDLPPVFPALAVEYISPAALRPNPRNARLHSKAQLKRIQRSIRQYGFLVPAIVDENGMIHAGNGRIEAAKQAGLATVPVIRVSHLSAAQMKAFALADNRLTELSSWDDELLAGILGELSEISDLPELETGFDMGEIDLLIAAEQTAGPDGSDSVPPPPPRPASSTGILWKLGRHRVLCGDARSPDSWKALMGDDLAAMCATDPPYNLQIRGGALGRESRHQEFGMASGEMTRDEFVAFLGVVIDQMVGCSRPGSIHYHFMDWRHLDELLRAGRDRYTELKNICVWAKDTAGMGSLYRSQHEMVCVFKSGKARHCNNIALGRHGRHRSNVWTYPSVSAFGRRSEEGRVMDMHPTVKPVQMIADMILDCSDRGDRIADPFLGSGTTLLACERTGRSCRGIELSPQFADVAVRRWQMLTGEKAVDAASGRTFDEMAAQASEGEQP